MGQLVVDEDRFTGMLAEVRPHLNELQWRLLLGAQARSLGRGGIKRVAQLTGVHPDTVGRGARELEQGIEPDGRVRRAGGDQRGHQEKGACATKRFTISLAQLGGIRRNIPGSDGLPGSERQTGDNSMPEKQWPRPGIRSGVLRDPSDTVKA